MPVEQHVLDTNYKHLKVIRTWKKTTIIKTIITIAIIVESKGGKEKRERGREGERRENGRHADRRMERETHTERDRDRKRERESDCLIG